ncbi:MAG: glycosyltransferase family 2 protein [Sulfuricurvum sp.]|nr:glycosyltransferase family 2 protein [Sulfuricurvum sp.]
MKTAILIPAYNAERTIDKIVTKCLTLNSTTIVVDNNSKDRTAYNSSIRGATVLKEYTKGQGAATRRGFAEVVRADYDAVITLDSDGQHNPEEIPILLKALSKADIVIGSRFINKYKAPRYRKFGIDIINNIYNIFNKNKLTDSQCCFRAYNKKALLLLNIEENGFGFSTELLIKARKLGLKMIEVPVSCIYHSKLENNSTLNPVKHGMIVAFKTLYWRLKLWN